MWDRQYLLPFVVLSTNPLQRLVLNPYFVPGVSEVNKPFGIYYLTLTQLSGRVYPWKAEVWGEELVL